MTSDIDDSAFLHVVELAVAELDRAHAVLAGLGLAGQYLVVARLADHGAGLELDELRRGLALLGLPGLAKGAGGVMDTRGGASPFLANAFSRWRWSLGGRRSRGGRWLIGRRCCFDRRRRGHRVSDFGRCGDDDACPLHVGAMRLLGFPWSLERANRMMFVLLAYRLLPFTANALARRDSVVGAASDRLLNRHPLGLLGRPHGPEDAPARGSQLGIAVLGEDALLQCTARLAITPRSELTLAETIELH